jgi:DNA repair exonuclease SbcCD ATPase subunit
MKAPFIKIDWEDVAENFTPERIKRVKAYFQTKYNTKHVQVITKTLSDKQNTRLKTLEVTDNILDPVYQKTLMRDFLTENNVNVKWELVDRLDTRINSKIDETNENKVRYNKWFIKKVEFSNFLSFGNNNVIDFEPLNGITVIESNPRNFGGKSTSSVDLLMFLFFNTTTKTKTNGEIFNKFTDEDAVSVKGYITIDGDNYVISRSLTRKKSRAGEFNVKTELDFYKEKEDGTTENLTGEQRRETEEFIKSAIGTEEDFLSTILTTGYNLEELIDSKPTARGQILTKFLGLESLKQKEETCRLIYNDWAKKLISNTNNIVDLQNDNETFKENIETSKSEIIRLGVALETFKSSLKSLEETRDALLSSRNNDIDQDLIRTNPVSVQREIDDLKVKQASSKTQSESVVVTEPSKFYLEEEHDKVRKEISSLQIESRVAIDSATRNKATIKQFEEGTICPTCKRALEDVDHTNEIESLKKEISDAKEKYEQIKEGISVLETTESSYAALKREYDEYERNKLRKERFLLEVDQKQLEIDAKQLLLDRYEENKSKLEANQKIDSDIINLRSQIETANGDIRNTNTSIERNRNNITNLTEKIDINDKLIEKIKSEEELQSVFKIYLSVYGKNGISKTILKNMIPLINDELQRLLVDSCYFILELNINDKNELEFVMIDSETRVAKPLNAGSGYERTISSLALRSVLTKVSSLPKPNIVVMDEVFGKVADENLEMVGEFFKKIKNYFEHIFVISHNPLIRNWSDNMIMITKEDNVSSIEEIKTKINNY